MSAFPPLSAHSGFAQPATNVMWVVFAVCASIFALVCVLVVTALVRFRVRTHADLPAQNHGNVKLEVGWTVGPVLVVAGLFAYSAWAMQLANPTSDQRPELRVVAHQWWWEIEYPGSGVRTANEVHLPVGAKWRVQLESADVIHDFWVPQLAPKMDAIPGHPNFFWIQADAPGNYEGTCAEFCGAQHAWMRLRVVADSPAEFARWLEIQRSARSSPSSAEALRGEQLFAEHTCASCHSVGRRGTGLAPDLSHLRSRQTLGAGSWPTRMTIWSTGLPTPRRSNREATCPVWA